MEPISDEWLNNYYRRFTYLGHVLAILKLSSQESYKLMYQEIARRTNSLKVQHTSRGRGYLGTHR